MGIDETVLVALNECVLRHPDLGRVVIAYVEVAQIGIAALVVALFMLGRRRATRSGALVAGFSAGLAVALAQVVTAFVARARPWISHPVLVHVLVHHGPDRSFPSDSATAAFAIAVTLYAYAPRWGRVTLVLATALAVGRVAVGMHYPSDVLAGAVLGAAVARVLLVVVEALRGLLAEGPGRDKIADLLGNRHADRVADRL